MSHPSGHSVSNGGEPRATTAHAVIVAALIGGYVTVAYSAIWVLDNARAIRWTDAFVAAITTTAAWPSRWFWIVLSAAFLFELAVLGWSRSSIRILLRGSRTARSDMLVGAIHYVGWSSWLIAAFSGGALLLLHKIISPLHTVRLGELLPSPWLHALLVFVLIDFLAYWYHRISHEIEFLWQAHKFHHAATEFTILTGNRVHALEEILREVFLLIPLALLGTPAEMYLGFRFAILFFDLLQHSMAPWDYGWFGRWVIFSPVGHRIHHSPEHEHWDQNYGDILVIWDRIFGTWYGGNRVNDRVGVSENNYNQRSVFIEYLQCAALYALSLRESLRTGNWRTEYQRALRAESAVPSIARKELDARGKKEQAA